MRPILSLFLVHSRENSLTWRHDDIGPPWLDRRAHFKLLLSAGRQRGSRRGWLRTGPPHRGWRHLAAPHTARGHQRRCTWRSGCAGWCGCWVTYRTRSSTWETRRVATSGDGGDVNAAREEASTRPVGWKWERGEVMDRRRRDRPSCPRRTCSGWQWPSTERTWTRGGHVRQRREYARLKRRTSCCSKG